MERGYAWAQTPETILRGPRPQTLGLSLHRGGRTGACPTLMAEPSQGSRPESPSAGPQADRVYAASRGPWSPALACWPCLGFKEQLLCLPHNKTQRTLWRTKESGSASLWETSLHTSCDKKLALSEDKAQDAEAILLPEPRLRPPWEPRSRAVRPACRARSVSAAPAALVLAVVL